MKIIQIVLLVMPLLYMAGCRDNENEENEDNPVISGRKIYIVGSDDDGACYWVNESRVELPGGAWATDIVVVDGKVYTSGQGEIYEACYWINQEIYELPGNGGEAEAIAVDGDDVYDDDEGDSDDDGDDSDDDDDDDGDEDDDENDGNGEDDDFDG